MSKSRYAQNALEPYEATASVIAAEELQHATDVQRDIFGTYKAIQMRITQLLEPTGWDLRTRDRTATNWAYQLLPEHQRGSVAWHALNPI